MRHVRKGYADALRVNDGTGLVISRPDLQPDLTPVVERGVVPVSYLNSYVAEAEQPCAFCAKRTPHKRGYTVSLADGRIALCGHCCADRFFGKERAAALSSDYLQRHRLAMLRQAVANLQAAIPTLLDMLAPALVQFEKAALLAVKMISHEPFLAKASGHSGHYCSAIGRCPGTHRIRARAACGLDGNRRAGGDRERSGSDDARGGQS